ncbi:MAG: phosphate ABC transporter substrate-binding protein [Deltaproteobacteria bacterium]
MILRSSSRVRGVAAVASAMLGAVSACNRADTPSAEPSIVEPGATASPVRITIAGSSALVPLVTEAANRYMRAHIDVTIQVRAGGSRQGLAQVASGAVTIGNSDVFATGAQAAQLEDHRVAVVGFAAMAHRGSFNQTVTSLTQDQMRGVFGGQVRNWSQLGGVDQAITVINRARSSGTRAVFGSIVLGGDSFLEGTEEQDSSGPLRSMLLEQVGAISYLALSYRSESLAVMAYNGVEPTPENIAAGTYPIWSYEHMYTRGPATADVRAFLDFVASPEFQDDAVARLGFVPVGRMRVTRDHD